jgi:hypothetical protein
MSTWAPGSGIEHLPEQGHETIGAIGRRLPDLRMKSGYLVAAQIRQFPRAKDQEMACQEINIKLISMSLGLNFYSRRETTTIASVRTLRNASLR